MRTFKTWCDQKQPGIVLLPWLVPAVSALSLKYIILCIGGFRESALGLRGANFLTVTEKLLLFRSDLLLGFVLIPAALCALTFFLPPYVRVALSAILSFVAQILMTMEAAVYGATKGFATTKTLWAVVTWAVAKHEKNIIFLLPGELAGFATWVAAAVFSIALAFTCLRRPRPRLSNMCLMVFAAGATVTALISIPRAPGMAWSPALLKMTVHAALVDTDADDANMRARGVDELNQLYRKDSHFPPASPSPYFGRAQGENVLFFVLEATSARVFDPASDPLLDMPNARRLRERAFIAAKHYTTYPGTSQAVFSFFTSLYTKWEVGPEIGNRPVALPGMIRSLGAAGYRTAYYGYVFKVDKARDDRMFQCLGFERMGEPDIDDAIDRGGWETFLGPISYVENNDRQALQKLLVDIRGWTAHGQKFAAAFFPEIAHDPWRELPGRKSASQFERGHALAVHQDAWLGELIDELKRDGALDHTLIIVTADHGLRWSPAPDQHIQLASHGTLDEVTLRVPLLIYAPQILQRPQSIDWPTSHLDMTPTILDLLGVRSGRELEEGTSMLNPPVTQRRLFLWMDPYGAVGFIENGSYYMRTVSGTVFKSGSLHFEDGNILPFDSAEARRARQVLAEQGALQNALLFHLLEGRSL